MKKSIVILTGAGISAESGISTFRDSDGLWEQYRVEDVATPEGYAKDKKLVLDFYNQRRRQLSSVEPNEGHRQLVRLEEKYNVQIVTQNVDNLHERAGSSNVLHLHGELTKARSERDSNLITDIGYNDILLGDKASDGAQLRPHIVWFGEAVPNIEIAASMCEKCDFFIVIGTSMNVYPAAGLIHYVPRSAPCWLIDPKAVAISRNIKVVQEKAGTGVKKVVDELLSMA
jgi:NAD-dependent deacetylase